MIEQMWVSFKENIQNKTSNPFFGTLILVWSTTNWNLFYTLFNFNPNTTLEQKTAFIKQHFVDNPFLWTLAICAFEAFLFLVASYILINLSRLMVEFNDKQITPRIYKLTDKNSIVPKWELDAEKERSKSLEKKIDEERDAKLKIQAEYDRLEKRHFESLAKVSMPIAIEEPQKSIEKEITHPKLSAKATKILETLNKEAFEEIAMKILNIIAIRGDEKPIMNFTALGLVIKGQTSFIEDFYYTLTPLGQEIYEYLIMNKLESPEVQVM